MVGTPEQEKNDEKAQNTKLINGYTDGRAETVEYEVATPVLSNLDCFADAIAGKAEYPNTPEQIVQNVSLLEAIVKSTASQEIVKIER